MVRDKVADLFSTGLLESVTLKVRDVLVTGVVGVPVMAPVEALSDRLVGSVPEVSDQE